MIVGEAVAISWSTSQKKIAEKGILVREANVLTMDNTQYYLPSIRAINSLENTAPYKVFKLIANILSQFPREGDVLLKKYVFIGEILVQLVSIDILDDCFLSRCLTATAAFVLTSR